MPLKIKKFGNRLVNIKVRSKPKNINKNINKVFSGIFIFLRDKIKITAAKKDQGCKSKSFAPKFSQGTNAKIQNKIPKFF